MSSDLQSGPVTVLPSMADLPSSQTSIPSRKAKSHLRASRTTGKGLFLKRDNAVITEKAQGKEETLTATWHGVRAFPMRKMLVLDLDETLVHSVAKPELGDYQLTVQASPASSFQIGVRLRPFVKDFLSKVSQLFEVAIFTSAQAPYANTVIDFLDPTGTLIHHRLYRDHCTDVDGTAVKDLQIFRGIDLKDIIICDNIVSNFKLQLNNGIPIKTWTEDREDKELVLLMQYLMKIVIVPDVRVVNQHFFHLDTLLPSPAKSS